MGHRLRTETSQGRRILWVKIESSRAFLCSIWKPESPKYKAKRNIRGILSGTGGCKTGLEWESEISFSFIMLQNKPSGKKRTDHKQHMADLLLTWIYNSVSKELISKPPRIRIQSPAAFQACREEIWQFLNQKPSRSRERNQNGLNLAASYKRILRIQLVHSYIGCRPPKPWLTHLTVILINMLMKEKGAL